MTYPSGLLRDEAAAVANGFGVALDQVHRDHLISSILAALQAHTDDLIFFGGTALARTYLMQGRLSEDIDLVAVTDRRSAARAITRTIDRALRVTHGRVDWTVALGDIRDTESASLVTADGLIVRVQLLRANAYPPWPTAVHDIYLRYSDIAPTRLHTPVRDSFAGWKTVTWFERHAPRDLYDLWALALSGALTSSAARLFATHTGLGVPQDHTCSRQRRPSGTGTSSCPDRHVWPLALSKRLTSSARPGLPPDPDFRRAVLRPRSAVPSKSAWQVPDR